jgi:cytochrome P450
MREPYVFPLDRSPFSPDVPPLERRRRVLEVGADVVTDEIGAVIDFMSEVDVEGVLNDPRFAAVALPTLHLSGVADGPLYELWTHLMFAKDSDEHRRIRGVVVREFAPRRVERFRPVLEQVADDLCAAFPSGRSFEFCDAFAVPYAARVACVLVGIPFDDADRAAVWAFDLARAFFPFMSPERVARAERSAVELLTYIDALLEQRRAQPDDDLVSLLATGELGAELSPDEVRALAANMVFAGLEATAKAVATGLYCLLAHGQFARLVKEPDAVPSAVLEVLRFAPPAQNVARLAADDMVCQDVALRAGQVASANIVAACRDPQRYDNPDELDVTRHSGKQLAFGAGPHYCLGASLAKLGMETAFTAIATHHPELRLAAETEPTWDYEGFAGVVELELLTR